MNAPRVFISMAAALIVFAVATYALNGSISTTFWQTVLCAVLLQVGYFVGVLVLVSRVARQKRLSASPEKALASDTDPLKSKASPVSHLNTPGHPNR